MDNISDKQEEMLRRVCRGFSVDVIVAVLVDVYGTESVGQVYQDIVLDKILNQTVEPEAGIKQKG